MNILYLYSLNVSAVYNINDELKTNLKTGTRRRTNLGSRRRRTCRCPRSESSAQAALSSPCRPDSRNVTYAWRRRTVRPICSRTQT